MAIFASGRQTRLNSAVPAKPLARLTQGYLIALVGTSIWSSTAIFIRYLTETHRLPPLVLAFWRDLLVFLALGVVFAIANRRRLRVEPRRLKFLVLYGLVLAIFNALWTVSVTLNGAAVSTVLAYSSPAFTAILAWRLFNERLDRVKVLAVGLSIIGCAFVSGAYDLQSWSVNLFGITTGLLSGLAFAGYSLMGKAASEHNIHPWTTLLYTFGFAALFLLAFNLVPGWLPGAAAAPGWHSIDPATWLGESLPGWGALILLAVGPTIGGYGLYMVSLTYLPASVANLIATLEPSLTAVQAYLFLGERLSVPQLLGSALIVLGVIVLRLNQGSRLAWKTKLKNFDRPEGSRIPRTTGSGE